MMDKAQINEFGYYPSERYALNIVFLQRTAVASGRDKFWSIQIFPTEEQWREIKEILKETSNEKT